VPELHPVSVPECLNEVLELSPLPEQITVALNYPDNLPPVLGDGRQLQIVFGNLLRNARDAMLPQGGSLTISAQPVEGDVAVAIADTGAGIPRENLERIMEPLYSTKARGIGLGLAITRSIVDKHGGQIHVASELGVGSTFTVRLPAADQAILH
jgi:signal transduction histidine kinase